jgi:hypothetical protein
LIEILTSHTLQVLLELEQQRLQQRLRLAALQQLADHQFVFPV